MLHEFLLEIGCEELPPKALWPMVAELAAEIRQGLVKANIELTDENIQRFATPRRLAILLTGLPASQPDIAYVKKGPNYQACFDENGDPTAAAIGFAKSCNTTVDALEKSEDGKFLVCKIKQTGAASDKLLPDIIRQALNKLPIPKLMKWGNKDIQFVRPVKWVLMLFTDQSGKVQVIDTEILGQKAGNLTYGHRFHHPEAIKIEDIKQYPQQLKNAYVIADFHERQQIIRNQLKQQAKDATVIIKQELLDEVTALVEWPVALVANFDKAFLSVPKEALIAAMQDHQKSFALIDNEAKLLPQFITISNIESLQPQQVIVGNERVMRARLADAAFFYQQDQLHPLHSHIEATKKVIFQEKLGTLYDKSQRLSLITAWLAEQFSLDGKHAMRSAELSKCDLMTDMVGEFPELQGVMGYYYALLNKEDPAVASALKEQYLPRFAGDELPQSTLGATLALAERIDTLVGIFGINQRPTGAKDPFKLRRQALGIIRILIEKQYNVDLVQLIYQAMIGYGKIMVNQNVTTEVHTFILDRLKGWYQEQGVSSQVIAAVMERQNSKMWDFHQRIQAVNEFQNLADAQSLAIANKRVSNILQSEGYQNNQPDIDLQLLNGEAECLLAKAVQQKQQQLKPLFEQGNYTEALQQLASLREPIDRFFDEVMVLVEDKKIRNNRLAILAHLRKLFLQVADVSLLQQG